MKHLFDRDLQGVEAALKALILTAGDSLKQSCRNILHSLSNRATSAFSQFFENIRSYNAAFSMASTSAGFRKNLGLGPQQVGMG